MSECCGRCARVAAKFPGAGVRELISSRVSAAVVFVSRRTKFQDLLNWDNEVISGEYVSC